MKYDELMRRLYQSHIRFRQVQYLDLLSEMTHGEFVTLSILNNQQNKEHTTSSLSDIQCVSTAAISRTLKHLASKKWIERDIDSDDRRIVYVRLTDEGRAAYKRSKQMLDKLMIEALSQIDQEDLLTYVETHERLIEAMSLTKEKYLVKKERT